ncbi:methyltransferase [Serratia fonticola]|uniref:methyltransferase n=1 Tax=Serratia fonticola TaxID=47917 RepID=UPI003AF3459C
MDTLSKSKQNNGCLDSDDVSSPKNGVTISISPTLDRINYSSGENYIILHDPIVIIDRPRLARIPVQGENIINCLDVYPRTYEFEDITVLLSSEQQRIIWGPSIDTLMLMKAVKSLPERSYRNALEVGAGCGFLSLWIVGTERAEEVLGIDTNLAAVRCAQWNAKRIGLQSRCLFENKSFADQGDDEFDLILCNPPYLHLPTQDSRKVIMDAYTGTELLKEFLDGYMRMLSPDGVAYLIMSSASYVDPEVTIRLANLKGIGLAELIDQRDVPMKVDAVIRNKQWLSFLISTDGVSERIEDDYRYWHHLEVWLLRR